MTAHLMPRRKLPIGIQTFAKLRGEDCYYVDKTAHALQLIENGSYYRARGEPIHLIGVEFSKASRNIVGFEVETLQDS